VFCILLFNSVSYVFLLWRSCIRIVCILGSVYSIFIVPTDIVRLPWLRFFRAFSSVLWKMPGYTSQRRGTARTLPRLIMLFCVLFMCKCILYYCHRVSTQLQLIISYHKDYHVVIASSIGLKVIGERSGGTIVKYSVREGDSVSWIHGPSFRNLIITYAWRN
jgi:hypothetical protein